LGASSAARTGRRIPLFGERGEDLVDGGLLESRAAASPELPLTLLPPFVPVAFDVGED